MKTVGALAAVLVAMFLHFLFAGVAHADHSLGRPCINCHTLRSAGVVAGSRNVLESEVADPLYNADWYCSNGPWKNTPNPTTQPLDCSYCHKSDIALEIQLARGGKFNPPANLNDIRSSHPVDVQSDAFSYTNKAVKVYCNDCHAGDGGALTPAASCSKNDTDGYPNHAGTVTTAVPPGDNDVAANPPHLTLPYGNDVDWTTSNATFEATEVLCFSCHDRNNSTKPVNRDPALTAIEETSMVDVMGEYNLTGGGHNVPGIGGFGNKRLPCFNCHDPHSGIDPIVTSRANKSLIIAVQPDGAGIINPYEPANKNLGVVFSYSGYNPADPSKGDRGLCLACHNSSTIRIEGKQPVQFAASIPTANLKFGFHANVHSSSNVTPSTNCLQANGGCHQSPHNTSPFDCLGCHSSNNPNVAKFPEALARVANVDSEFAFSATNGIKSRHDITVDKTNDLSVPANNGCLHCHSVDGSASANLGRKVGTPGNTPFDPPTLADRRDSTGIKRYNPFCLECHGVTQVGFASGANTLYAPKVSTYYTDGGHGNTTDYLSRNPAGNIACLDCHVYHGSTTFKLLPGNKQTTDYSARAMGNGKFDKGGRVVKGFDYSDTVETAGTRFTLGGVTNTLSIDYQDYTVKTLADNSDANVRLIDNKRRAWKFANYKNTSPWNSYYAALTGNAAQPDGTEIQFGTAGNPLDTTKIACTDQKPYAKYAGTGTVDSPGEIGFCNACHQNNEITAEKAGTTEKTGSVIYGTYGWVFTHEGVYYTPSLSKNCNNNKYISSLPDFHSSTSGRNFQKDCTECHDPHGSGSSTGGVPNLYMIRGRMVTGFDTTWDSWNLVFKSSTTADSFDEAGDGAGNRDDICAVCHTATLHNLGSTSGAAHNEGTECITCHKHGSASEYPWTGFAPSGCDQCHGYPPGQPTTGGLPNGTYRSSTSIQNYAGGAGLHVEHVDIILAKTGVTLDQYPTKVVCGPCHGEGAGTDTTHAQSGYNNATMSWSTSARKYVNIASRSSANSWTTNGWGGTPSYGGVTIPTVASSTGAAMDTNNSRCITECHGNDSTTYVSWALPLIEPATSADPSDELNLSKVCKSCHDKTVPDIRIYDASGTLRYGKTGSGSEAQKEEKYLNVAANYYGTVSGYGRGGHGDARLSTAGLDVNSSAEDAPVDCTACHDNRAAHFPPTQANMHRLRTDLPIENSSGGICNSCHIRSKYPDTKANGYKHHPSYADIPWADAVNSNVTLTTSWSKEGDIYVQSGYAPGNTTLFGSASNKNLDYFTDWYNGNSTNHNQSPSPRGVFMGENGAAVGGDAPKATLPLSHDVTNSSVNGKIMCITCHNPHGTDLYVHDWTSNNAGKDIADHNMLRLQDTDNTLCVACH